MATEAETRAVLAQYRAELAALPYVQGVAFTRLNGDSAILVMLNRPLKPGEWLPSYLEGVRLITRVTGRMEAI